jgi:hypothetical protein
MESAMSEQINEQAEKMREMAQTTLDKAKEAVSKYITESQKLREKADSSVRSTASGFELAQRLLHAKDPQEMGAVYQSHLKEQMEKMNAQFRELASAMNQPSTVDLNK